MLFVKKAKGVIFQQVGGYGSLNSKAYSGIDVDRIVKDVKIFAKQNKFNISNRIKVTKQIQKWLKQDYKVITNPSGDKIFLSKDGLRRVRFDLKNAKPHKNPHGHIEWKRGADWIKSGPIYPNNVLPE